MREWMGGSEVLPGSGGLAGRVPDPGGTALRNGGLRAFSPGRLFINWPGAAPAGYRLTRRWRFCARVIVGVSTWSFIRP